MFNAAGIVAGLAAINHMRAVGGETKIPTILGRIAPKLYGGVITVCEANGLAVIQETDYTTIRKA